MEYEIITYNLKNPDKKDVEAMRMWIDNGCVKSPYLEKVLGDISIGVSAFKE